MLQSMKADLSEEKNCFDLRGMLFVAVFVPYDKSIKQKRILLETVVVEAIYFI